MNDQTLDSMDILDMTLDDLEDLPSFEPFVAGAHRVLVSMDLKKINDMQNVEVSLKLMETLELADPTKDEVQKEGSETSILCGLGNEWGQGEFKKIATPIGIALGISNNRELIEAAKNIECIVVTYVQVSKKDSVSRTKIKELAVA